MDYKEKVLALLNSQELSKEQKEKLEHIFPELKESENEKIRKHLITLFKNEYGQNSNARFAGIKVKNIIDWLEKQGEHANFRNKIQIGDKVTRNRDGVLVNLSQLNRVAKIDEKQGNNADKIEYRSGESTFDDGWSEEDERMYRGLYNLIYSTPYCDSRKEFSDWFKSLKDRVRPQSHWKQSDEQMIDFEYCVENNCCDKDGYNGGIMVELLEQLKKLKE